MTDRDMVLIRFVGISGEQRIYRWGDWGLSVVNGPMLHSFPFAREAAVVRFRGDGPLQFDLSYATPLTSDVEVFGSDDEADAFVARAREYFTGLDTASSEAVSRKHDVEELERNERTAALVKDLGAR